MIPISQHYETDQNAQKASVAKLLQEPDQMLNPMLNLYPCIGI